MFLVPEEERDNLYIECLTPNGMAYKVPSIDKSFIKKNFIDGDYVSGETDMIFEGGIQMDISTSELVSISTPRLIKKKYLETGISGSGRKLATTGERTVLAIRVVLS